MSDELKAVRFPELVFGIAGPLGIDTDELTRTLVECLDDVGYGAVPIKITDEIKNEESTAAAPEGPDFYSTMKFKMDHASAICRKFDDPGALMRYAIDAIRQHRAEKAVTEQEEEPAAAESDPIAPEDRVQIKTAYIIRQLKRPAEVELLRRVYGKQFILVSAYGPIDQRKLIIEKKLKRSLPLSATPVEISCKADDLMHKDANEDDDDFGQHLRDTFHLADVFVDGIHKKDMLAKTKRFIDALFGRTDIAPTKAEYGMYAAKSASLRSSDLSRQVGAAIFTPDGELITQGCNEVPKAFGGTYWDTEEPDYRDVKLGHDPNEVLKREVVRDLLERLSGAGMLSEKATKLGSSADIVNALIKKPEKPEEKDKGLGALADADVMELTEYGRVVHAEMCAICDAARLGKSVKGATLFCTTFPCHNCTKHILAAGITRVIYMEPYPKSKAKVLHENEISIERDSSTQVSYMPFLGISPYRYRDIFQKGKRKKDGAALRWYARDPRPMIDILAPTYTELEQFELARLIGKVGQSQTVHATAATANLSDDGPQTKAPDAQ